MTRTTTITNARYLVTVDAHDTVLEHVTITVTDGTITAITPADPSTDPGPSPRHEAEPGAQSGPSPRHEAEPGAQSGPSPRHEAEPGAQSGPSPRHEAEPESSPRPLAGPGGSRSERQRAQADGVRPRDDSGAADPATTTGPPETTDADGMTVIDATGCLVMPGLVNLHTHLPMTLLRGLAEDVDLDGFLRRVWAAEGAVMDPDTVELGATLGALESLLGGCTTQLDMYVHHEAAHRGAVAAGSRHVGGPTFFDGPGPDGLEWPERMDRLRAWRGELDRTGGPEVPVAAMPHAAYTCSPEHLAEVAVVLREEVGSAEAVPAARALLHTHVSETAAENAEVARSLDGRSPTEVLADAGWLDGEVRVVAGHGVHLSPDDLGRLAAAGGAVAHCPGSNLKLASGALPWSGTRDAGVVVGIGTDGCSSSNDLDMWQAMRQAALLARLTSGRPDVASAHEVLRAATLDGARALGLDDLVGSVEPGKRADLVVVDLERPHLTPVHDVHALLVFAAGRADVRDVLVDGEPVVRDRRSTRVDEAVLLGRARERGAAARAAAEGTADHAGTEGA